MTILDAQAVVALLVGEPAAEEVGALLRDPGDPSCISAVNVAEVIDVLVRIMGRDLREVDEKLDWLEAGGMQVMAVDEVVGRTAGRLHAENYRRRDRPLSMADCIALGTAIVLAQPLATSDPPLAATAREQGCAVVALPDARGERPR